MQEPDDTHPAGEAEPMEPVAPRKRKPARKKGLSRSDWQFLIVSAVVVWGLGFLVGHYIVELTVVESLVAAPICLAVFVVAVFGFKAKGGWI